MNKYTTYHNYDLNPHKEIKGAGSPAYKGYESILKEISQLIQSKKRLFVFDFYPGVDKQEVLEHLKSLQPELLIDIEDCAYTGEELTTLFYDNLTEDRVFGVMTHKNLIDCFDKTKLEKVQDELKHAQDKITFIFGTGAGLVTSGDVYFYFDLCRWEIQLRYRKGMPNWRCENYEAPILSKYKRGFFVEWRIADRYKKKQFDKINYLIDTNIPNQPKMITGDAFRYALNQISEEPFRVQPYFDPGVWGGQWMKEVFGLDQTAKNYAWSFDGVPEENSLRLLFDDIFIDIPCIDLVLYRPQKLLGEKVHARFGAEFPIRFDLLDTMGGENLSLQVHPLTEYIQETFGMHYTQDESYYILDTDPSEDTFVYLGLKEGIDQAKMAHDLREAENGSIAFPAKEYINCFPVKKHDHILIPAGTIHCSGKNTMVLEISATPYIFTFKLWDWDRLGLDGLPRPVHIEHGLQNIQWDRTTSWIEQNLIHQSELCYETKNIRIERTGLHEREFIDTYRYTFSSTIECTCKDSVNVLNLVDGAQVTIFSPTNQFDPFELHFAETVIIPASVGTYGMKPSGISTGKAVMVITASVK
ncbi:MAG: mannose-6-phosphate isomerase [Herbinix sp.]|jgi:mannose-6-phosphate isomerase class I|nr:mannose-6-phosphate isomerase [Herbinix sp.]